MSLETWIRLARSKGASDVHLEPGLPAVVRVRGRLHQLDRSAPAQELLATARSVVGERDWPAFLTRRSYDMSRVIAGVRCRINVLQSARGVGFAIRLLAGFQPTIERLNLHPDIGSLARREHGLILVSGATGSGKSSTLAALVERINGASARHIVTVERPIEYTFRPRLSLIRQREVGRDTPSFQQALLDALREDPDVIVVGEMRDPPTMAAALDAAETGHLVLATMHAASSSEALQRIVASFAPEAQAGVRAQLASCLEAVVCQRMTSRGQPPVRVPECEVLVANSAIRSQLRDGAFFKVGAAMETGAREGMWTFARYRRWLDDKRQWQHPDDEPLPEVAAEGRPAERLRAGVAGVEAGGGGSQDEGDGAAVVVVDDDAATLDDLVATLKNR